MTRRTVPSFFESIRFYARTTPHAIAVDRGAIKFSYQEFVEHIEKVTRILHARQIPAGARVAVHVEDGYLHSTITAALSRLGLVSTSVQDPARELAILGAGALVADQPDAWDVPMKIQASSDWLEAGAQGLPAFQDTRFEQDHPARIVLSSGTTGQPKKVLFTYETLHQRNRTVPRHYGMSAATRLLCMVGSSTVGGYQLPITVWCCGGTVLQPKFRRGTSLASALMQCPPNLLFAAPVQLASMLDQLPKDFYPFRDLEVYLAGSVLTSSLARRARLHLTSNVVVLYGSTEAGSVSMAYAASIDDNPGFAGVVAPTAQVEIVDDEHRPVAEGEQGTVRVRTEAMGSYADEAPGADNAFRDGWFYPGDVGRLQDGRLTILGRTQQMMNLGGVKLTPEMVEEALLDCPGVKELAAFAVPGPAGVDDLWLAVVGEPGFDAAPLHQRFRAKFPHLSTPSIARMEAIPRNEMGKVLRTTLRSLVERQRPAAPVLH
jgi:acyl-coenzyme A synthetase/AMP-(fatty) acid ligase